MSHREFRDETGREWEVWDVHPAGIDQLREDDIVEAVRQRHRRALVNLPNELRDGWLAFKSDGESRRLAPIPTSWVALGDQELAVLVRSATRIGRITPRL